MPQLDVTTFSSQIFWLVVSFSLLYFFLSKIFLPKFSNLFQDREHAINQAVLEAEAANKEIKELKEEYENLIHQVNNQRFKLTLEANQNLADVINEKIKANNALINQILIDAKKELADFENNSKELIVESSVLAIEEILKAFSHKKLDRETILSMVENQYEQNKL